MGPSKPVVYRNCVLVIDPTVSGMHTAHGDLSSTVIQTDAHLNSRLPTLQGRNRRGRRLD